MYDAPHLTADARLLLSAALSACNYGAEEAAPSETELISEIRSYADAILTGPPLYFELAHAELRVSEDPAKEDLELVCTGCETYFCDVQDGDTLEVLARTFEHACSDDLTATEEA